MIDNGDDTFSNPALTPQQEADLIAQGNYNIWEEIREQEQLAIRAILDSDTAWIETRKQNIIELKALLK